MRTNQVYGSAAGRLSIQPAAGWTSEGRLSSKAMLLVTCEAWKREARLGGTQSR